MKLGQFWVAFFARDFSAKKNLFFLLLMYWPTAMQSMKFVRRSLGSGNLGCVSFAVDR